MTSSNAEKRKGMPTAKAIKKHWAQWLVTAGKFDSIQEVLEDDYCFACGFTSARPLERAHILALAEGGDNHAENLHMLCHLCHKASEFISGDAYFQWFDKRNMMHRLIEAAVKDQTGGATNVTALLEMLGVK